MSQHTGWFFFPWQYHGVELTADVDPTSGSLSLTFDIEGSGFGAILATTSPADDGLAQLLTFMKQLTATPLASFSWEWNVRAKGDSSRFCSSQPAGLSSSSMLLSPCCD